VLSIAGEMITEDEVIRAVRECGIRTDRYYLAPDGFRYVLSIDGESVDPAVVDEGIRRANPAYRSLRSKGYLQCLAVRGQTISAPPGRKPARTVSQPEDAERSAPAERLPAT